MKLSMNKLIRVFIFTVVLILGAVYLALWMIEDGM